MRFLTLAALILLVATQAATLDVTDYGAVGDAIKTHADASDGNVVLALDPTNSLSVADVGKYVELFGCGPSTGSGNQDLITTIASVSSGTNVTLSVAPSRTLSGAYCIIGTQNAEAFQDAVDACAGSADIISIPAGTYLMIPPEQITGFTMSSSSSPVKAAVVVSRGGIAFSGAGSESTILLGCGAWKLQGSYAHRGNIISITGPITNPENALTFQNLTFDGGVETGNTSTHTFPASALTGEGWDLTHDAVVDRGSTPMHASKTFNGCSIVNWRGEALKSTVALTDGSIVVTNCLFANLNASGFNFSFTHDIVGCTFTNAHLIMEFYEGYADGPCYFRNCVTTNITSAGLVINGALTNRVNPTYIIDNNDFGIGATKSGIYTTPAQNLIISSNRFYTQGTAISIGVAGYQGSTVNSNIVVSKNVFTDVSFPFQIIGSGVNSCYNISMSDNTATTGNSFAYGTGWSTNVVFLRNTGTSIAGLNSTLLDGQWFKDDVSNSFTYRQNDDAVGVTNAISYKYGMRHKIQSQHANSVWTLDDTLPIRMPFGSVMVVTNSGVVAGVTLYLSRTNYPSANSVSLSKGGSEMLLYWNELTSMWQTNSMRNARSTGLRLGNLKGR